MGTERSFIHCLVLLQHFSNHFNKSRKICQSSLGFQKVELGINTDAPGIKRIRISQNNDFIAQKKREPFPNTTLRWLCSTSTAHPTRGV